MEYVGVFNQKAIKYFEENQFNHVTFENPDVAVESTVTTDKMTNKQKRKNFKAKLEFEKGLLVKCYQHYKKSPPALVIFEVLNTSWTVPFVKLGVPLLGISITLLTEFNLNLPSVHTNYVPSKKKNLKDSLFILKDWLIIYVFVHWKYKILNLLVLRWMFGFSKIPKINFKQFFRKNDFRLLWGDYPLNDFRISIPCILCCPQEFDFPHRKRSDEIFYAGSSILLNRKENVNFDWVKLDLNRKNIYVTLGFMPEYTDKKLRVNFFKFIIQAAMQL
ncbi:hypothetical protein [Aquimarina intermedia]|uniref:Uncharacterized protein n=1 Tax=Aquimarina intermedia TaxID=350814 RepID=A0A5S5C4U2_9FLAO|nr:hypothetical protein [Aquimarina intermedia]TYP74354.1 hypothetical protein BD809_104174 [Aquimarina intermedia]